MRIHHPLFLLLLTLPLAGCEAIGGIFRAGIWTGVIAVVIVVAVIAFVFSRFRGRA